MHQAGVHGQVQHLLAPRPRTLFRCASMAGTGDCPVCGIPATQRRTRLSDHVLRLAIVLLVPPGEL